MSINRVTRKYHLEVGGLVLSDADVRDLIRKYDFYCCEADIGARHREIYSNPQGKGVHTPYLNTFALYHNKEIVYDRLTGLCWQRSGSTRELTWSEGGRYAVDLERAEYGGLRGWHLPSLAEAMSLVEPSGQNYDRDHPQWLALHINPIFNVTQRWLWTFNFASTSSEAWKVNFAVGACDPEDTDIHSFVRAVASYTPSEDQLEEISQHDLEGSIKPAATTIFDFSAGKCGYCKGTGKQPCQICGSSGSITRSYPSAYQTITTTTPCPKCGGGGFISCPRCHGSGQT